ncbi:unnamed protein product [Phaedon cochleariae]|uniref:Uncharacterized protein n=1 Tax=Phaedon cochleariae TaxID=80249 RepID=A0A9N9WY92_PHACE|nr:unnamed protein product [Phaedon cochleariae]
MPELADQMYCSEQISVPPSFPYLLRQYAKSAIRTQPVDLLQWSTAYFRCLSLNIPPPVKPRLEYPIPRSHRGLTPGWLKALIYQLQGNQSVPFKVLWDRWTGACLAHGTLIEVLCVGGFKDAQAIPWSRFVGLCAAHLTDDLTTTMKLICEIMTEEPEGGSAMIPLETFIDLYEFLAKIDASKPQKLQNLYFTDSLLSLWMKSPDQGDQPVVTQEESVYEEESIKSHTTERSESEETEKELTKEEISCPSLVDAEPADPYSMDYYIQVADGEAEDIPAGMYSDYDRVHDAYELEGEGQELQQEEEIYKEMLDEEEEKESKSERSEDAMTADFEEIREYPEPETTKEAPQEKDDGDKKSSVDVALDDAPNESVDTIQEVPRKIMPEEVDDEKRLLEDLQRLQAMQQEISGETDEEVEKFKCKLIEEMPLSASQEVAIDQFKEAEVPEEQEKEQEKETVEDDKQEEKKSDVEEVNVEAIPGIGPIVPDHMIKAVCDYMRSVSTIQHGMVMPRNIRHYNCPPLEILDYGM